MLRGEVCSRLAEFYSVEDIVGLLRQTGFQEFHFRQTLFGPPKETSSSEPVDSGYGEGSFVALRASAPAH
jgi:hypothetical protein